ncbi:recombinase family protein [Clostridium felsineum]|uniref:Uncharacterized protein n=1 Tax=Clostridium felsineum TaxID=36839 RepID=A0A1S8L3Z6_9CLOT|nr:recombinase family protein [Clostridium felsineum]URZ07567.1 hypothetical protein CLROS_029060 [Clostridium felsineum]URZ12598.1 hypothetical protein CROST_033210 [Clostridium felsineum]
MLKGVTYNRFSSNMQREESIDAQIRFNHDYAKRNNIEVMKDYIDEAISGKTDDRPGFQKMLEDAKLGMFDVVICHKVDRFARNRIESAINKYNLRKCNIKVLFSGQAIDDSPEGQLMEGILESFAEYYSLNLAKETMKGLRENAYKCKFNGGYVPFGFSIDPETKKYLINTNEAPYVQMIFKMFVNGTKYKDIIKTLDDLGITTRFGRKFTEPTLHDLLCNEKYAGIYTFNKRTSRSIDGKRNGRLKKSDEEIISIPGGIPQIIDTDTFIQAQEKLCLKKRTTRAKEIYLLSGLIYCGSCGKPYCGNRKHNGFGKIYTMYRCNGRCENKEIDKDFLEEMVFTNLINNIFSKKALKELSKKLNEYLKSKRQSENKKLEVLSSKLKEISFEQNNIVNAIAKGYDNPIFKKRLSELDAESKNIKYEYDILKIKLDSQAITPNRIDKILQDQRTYVLNKNLVEVKKFIASYVDSIIVYENDIEINLKFDSIPI